MSKDAKTEYPYQESLRDKILAIIQGQEPSESAVAEFRSGYLYAKGEIIKKVQEGQL